MVLWAGVVDDLKDERLEQESPSGQSSCQELGRVKKGEGTVVGYHRERRT